MKKNLLTILAAATVFVVSFSFNIQAATIAGLYNTGAGITVNGTKDTHYALSKTSGAPVSYTNGYAAVGSGWPIGPWLADTSVSHWLTPTTTRGQSFDPSANGQYTWTLSFDLTGFDFTTAAFAGRFAADNSAIAYLNGVQIGTANSFTNWYSFSATHNLFKAGINTIQFVVNNLHQATGNPTGLRVEFTSSSVNPVPVPAAIWLFGSALTALAVVKRRDGYGLRA